MSVKENDMKNSIMALVVSVMLAGCITMPERERIVVKTTTVVADIPEAFLAPCTETPPPDKAVYLGADLPTRESYLVDYALDLTLDLRQCNEKITSTRLRLKDQKARFEQTKDQDP